MPQQETEKTEQPGTAERPSAPAAGPHAEPSLTNPDATPGTGALPPPGPAEDPNMQSTG